MIRPQLQSRNTQTREQAGCARLKGGAASSAPRCRPRQPNSFLSPSQLLAHMNENWGPCHSRWVVCWACSRPVAGITAGAQRQRREQPERDGTEDGCAAAPGSQGHTGGAGKTASKRGQQQGHGGQERRQGDMGRPEGERAKKRGGEREHTHTHACIRCCACGRRCVCRSRAANIAGRWAGEPNPRLSAGASRCSTARACRRGCARRPPAARSTSRPGARGA